MSAHASRVLVLIGLAGALALTLPTVAAAQYGPSTPTVQRRNSPAGATEVNYYSGGGLTSETNVPTDSRFWTSGAGSGGGTPVPCGEFTERETEIVDPDGPEGPELPVVETTETITPSLNWHFFEIEAVALGNPNISFAPGTFGAAARETFGGGVPLADASRRFTVKCLNDAGPGELFLPFVDVPMTDPFWNPLDRLGLLWNSVELPDYSVATPIQVETYGGLVVNMPTWLQIDAAAWQPYFSPVDSYKGWDSQLQLYPASLEFTVASSGGDGATVPCAPENGTGADGGVTPARPDDLPRYATRGQVDGYSCTWVPKQKGDVTVRATITYDVLLTISGYSEWLSPYSWSSDPLTFETNELRFVNVKPEGGG